MIRRKIKKIKFYLILISSLFLLMSLYLEFQPTPEFLTNFMRKEFSKRGYRLELKNCYIRLWGKSEISNFKISSKSMVLTGHNLKINFSIINFLSKKSIIENFYGKNISISIRSENQLKEISIIPNANFKGSIDNNDIFIKDLSFVHFNTLFTINGTFSSQSVLNSNSSSQTNFSKEWFYITKKILFVQKKLDFNNKLIKYNITFDLNNDYQVIKNSINIPSFSKNGVKCEAINIHFSYLPKSKIIDIDRLSINLNKNAKVHGSALININNQLLSSEIFINSTPQSILDLVSQNFNNYISPYLPKFPKNTPPSISIRLENAPLTTPLEWKFKGTIDTKNCTLNNLQISKGKSKFILDVGKKIITLNKVNLDAKGLKGIFDLVLDFETKTIFLTAKGKGDPRLFNNFIWDNPKVKERLISIWDGFVWDKNNYPEFELEFINTFNDSRWLKEPNVITEHETIITESKDYQFKTFLKGNFKINNFSYLNQPIKQSSADIYLKFPQFLILKNITVDNGDGTITNGKYIIDEESRTVNFNSSVSLPFLNKVSPYPITLPKVVSYQTNPNIEFNGIFFNEEYPHKQNRIDAVAVFPKLKFIDTPATNNLNQLTLRGDDLAINSFGNIHNGSYTSFYKQNTTKLSGALQLNIQNIDFAQSVQDYKKDSPYKEASGKISAQFDLHLDYNVKEKDPINITGQGQGIISKGAFAKIPLLSFLPVSLAKITRINAPKILFKGQKIYFPQQNPIITNGSILSLTSYGTYDWNTFEINFKARPRLFKDFRVLLPLSYITPFKATGFINDPQIKLDW